MTIYLPEEDRSYLSKSYLEDEIASLLGGRVAEQIALGDISTGASNDLQRPPRWPIRWWRPMAERKGWALWPLSPDTTRCSSGAP